MTQTEIIKKYPELFGKPPFDPMKTLIGFGFEVNKGWIPILEEGFQKIADFINKNEIKDFRIQQVKEKFGGLRVYCNYYMDPIDDIIDWMEEECAHTCDVCGSPDGKLRQDMWMAIRCDSCYSEWKSDQDKRIEKGKEND